MKIIIAGAGEVGTHLAKLLSKENLDIVLIDTDIEKLRWLDLNYNLMTIAGSPTSLKILKQAGINEADLFIAVMPFETRNSQKNSVLEKPLRELTITNICYPKTKHTSKKQVSMN